jgi:hypothetical protein
LAKEIDAAASGRIAAEKQAYMSLPRPGVGSSSSDTSSLNERVQNLSVVDFGVSVCNDLKRTNKPSINFVSNQSTPNSSTSPESLSKIHQNREGSMFSSGYGSAEISSAFVPYKRQPLPETVHFYREQPNAPVILRQKVDEAPLAKFDEDDLLVEKKTNQFENRMSFILDTLKTEASLNTLRNYAQ